MPVFQHNKRLLACLGFLLAGCEDHVTEASQMKPGLLDICAFEATVPAEALFDDIAGQFAVNRQFCSWASFAERKLVGITFLTTPDLRKPSEILNGVPDTAQQVCNVQSMLDAGWKLKPLTIEAPEQYSQFCGKYGIHVPEGDVAAFGADILELPQLCFQVDEREGRMDLRALGTTLSMRWTLPVRFHTLDREAMALRLWFDDSPHTGWAGDWPELVVAAAGKEGVKLVQQPCADLPSTRFDTITP